MLDVGDAAEALVQLAGSSESFGRAWTVASPEAITGRQFIELAFKGVGRKPDVGSWGRGIVLTGGFLSSGPREVLKMPYDYYSPLTLDGREFAELIPAFHFTSAEKSISQGIKWYQAGQ
jgi:nucleoside-diphosphate-sugar epimerase